MHAGAGARRHRMTGPAQADDERSATAQYDDY
jgi:hypothetical protein